jgi:hypothetical protein
VGELVKAGKKRDETDSKLNLTLWHFYSCGHSWGSSTGVLASSPKLRTRRSQRLPSVTGTLTVRKKHHRSAVLFGAIGVSK